jgi:hypothetical protein
VLAAVREALPGMGTASRNSLTKVGCVVGPGGAGGAAVWLMVLTDWPIACVLSAGGMHRCAVEELLLLGSCSACLADHALAAPTASCVLRPPQVVSSISHAFDSCFQHWSVGLGIEQQLEDLRRECGLPPRPASASSSCSSPRVNLDYELLVKPSLVEATLTREVYSNSEDFFFRWG